MRFRSICATCRAAITSKSAMWVGRGWLAGMRFCSDACLKHAEERAFPGQIPVATHTRRAA